ncbi:carboxypeptidase-like regulatory domain-containing protein [Hymenobacter sp. 15J16-1T3B]|uniref:carboxypeptidase-like regulatory domain-containing protein n=1 Tax=Hymenobacter sp. 15J16-1T3B TaxID=2886941 RepID=UPI001D10168E|nr:carboxypeptidase-like regulatory domain-containing protein [Hymenobacter sp. 15J16-1T3B]MCC3158952.1 carboxypeptidase-like regulatory domain-containing protein [Hymenobacter sp. 15J16-1T3B]
MLKSFCLLLLFLPTATFAQRVVSGRVVAQGSNEPLPQVTVRVEGQPTTVVTDKAGRFSLTVPTDAATLAFSHVGYQALSSPAAQLGPDVALAEQRYVIGEVQISYVQLQKLLLRQWRIAPASIDAAAQLITARMQARDPKKAETLAQNPDAVRRVMEMARYDFRPDGVVKAKLLLASNKMHWQLDEETRTLTVVNDEGTERKISVVDLTADRLVLKHAEGNAPEITYVPAD